MTGARVTVSLSEQMEETGYNKVEYEHSVFW